MWAAEESCRQEGVIEVCIGRVRLATRQLFLLRYAKTVSISFGCL